jgi:ABC-2 type transport system ATP-binding protein
VQAFAADGRLVVYSSHVLALVEQVATTVLILQNGTAVGHGTVAELRDMLQQPSLEMVFRQVTAEQDTSAIARNLMDAIRA